AVGTPGYIPSEQSNGKPKLSSDIYAVGMVGIKALTGKDPQSLPTDPKTGNIIWRNKAEVSNDLANVLDKMVREYFSERYQNAMEAMEALNVQTSGKLRLGNKTRRQILILVGLAGSGTEAERSSDESPQHYVDVPEFLMGKYAVTQAQWEAVMGNNPARFKGANRPVESVSWNDATEFCRKLSRITGKQYSLPSESQWEYACRARTTTPFYFGETITSELVNHNGNGTYADAPKGKYRKETTDVGIFPPNAFGLYDMHGNVYEWCQDVWHENYNGAPTDGSAWETGGNSGFSVLRGGSWDFFPRWCRSSLRGYYVSIEAFNNGLGFRLVSFLPRN
ncbi:MAG: SUMF1/EgtB/PvdO family nonheme iron enzyme, partial [Trichodesmium sp. St16_bin4-tuft]|nr:SUMF1/EgtB/PvdO family nonheme iron enzyme [Trichodesmium sp. St16_bin4-tuft]